MPTPPSVHASYLSADDTNLLAEYAVIISSGVRAIVAEPLGRVGRSGASVNLVYFDEARKSIPFVVKMHDTPEIEAEQRAIEYVRSHFEDALPGCEPHFLNNRGAIAYKHIAASGAQAPLKTTEL